jgi:hypothetical protein
MIHSGFFPRQSLEVTARELCLNLLSPQFVLEKQLKKYFMDKIHHSQDETREINLRSFYFLSSRNYFYTVSHSVRKVCNNSLLH